MPYSESAVPAPALEIPGSESEVAAELVESPGTPSSPNAWARFEFETGCGNEGTKVLVVEWDPTADGQGSESARPNLDGWRVTWEGKISRDKNEVKEVEGRTTFRVLILIEDEAQVPSVVTISQASSGHRLIARPMPAIYTPALGADVAKAAGKRGVLHTQWAEKRLRELQAELEREVQINAEGVAVTMAFDDITWVASYFGLEHPYLQHVIEPAQRGIPLTPQTPRSPIGGRLGEKLRGLKLATSPTELANSGGQRQNQHYFAPGNAGTTARSRSGLSTSITAGTGDAGSGVASLDAMVGATSSAAFRPPLVYQTTEDELFALPMSPRSPEMKKSPFSMIK